jgi:hypothetical protein
MRGVLEFCLGGTVTEFNSAFKSINLSLSRNKKSITIDTHFFQPGTACWTALVLLFLE